MAAHIINGKKCADDLIADIQEQISQMPVKPCLAVVIVGDDPASHVYVDLKVKACEKTGMVSRKIVLPADTQDKDLLNTLEDLARDSGVHGVLMQLPLPNHLDANKMIQAIPPHKDVDGLTAVNLGQLMIGDGGFIPCTPQGVMRLFEAENIDLQGKHAVIIGRSRLFGKPMGQLLLNADCTVTQCHSKTQNLSDMAREADILIVAAGQPEMVKGDWVKSGAVVVDVGITRNDNNKIVGDVDFDAVKDVAGFITPVPGGVGPMTVACLLNNTLKAARSSL